MDFSGYYYTIHRGKYIKNYQRYENAIKAFYKLVGEERIKQNPAEVFCRQSYNGRNTGVYYHFDGAIVKRIDERKFIR